ncbi:MAG TPA: gliding motility-associated C-terminal domain-containing protein [Bacteroidia bacterium]|jgi:gliding motility-associated-like protein|nr:gliding motility-associated C-terminal domain-containing protein [Bacteroidia bacterium]
MKNLIRISLFFLALFCAVVLNAQISKTTHLPGTPCVGCATSGFVQKGNPNTIQNGNGTVATSYTVTQCGLGFTAASVRLNQRSFSGMTVPKGLLQPAPMVVSGIPPCYTIVKAFLYVGGSGNGVAITATIKNPALATNNYPMTLIGQHTDKCWGYVGTFNYRADVTTCISGNGTYTLSGIPCLGAPPNDMDGATLIIIYSDPSQTYTGHMVIGDGCREVSGGAITNTLTGFNVCGAANSTQNFVIVSDLQQIAATPINLNSAVANYTYPSASNNVWDYIQQPGAPATAGQTSAVYGFSNSSDCYNFVAAGMYYRTACNVCSSPNLTITAVTSSSCSAGSATATVAGGTGPYTYTWSPTGGNAASVSAVPTGNYTVSVKDATGCQIGTATVAISANAGPTITCASAAMCAGTSANLNATGALSYTWTPAATLNTASGPNVIASPATTTTYSVSGTNAVGCVATITTAVTVNALPVVVVNNPGTCVNQTINLTSTGGGTYSWTGPMAYSSVAQNPSIPNAVTGMSGAYSVLVTSAAGCTASAVSNVTVFPLPNPNITSNSPVCAGGTLNLFGTGGATYGWSGPGYTGMAQNPVVTNVTVGMSGVYTLLVSSGTCTASTTANIVINPLPIPNMTSNSPVCIGFPINFTGSGGVGYSWSGPGFSSVLQNPTIVNSTMANNGNFVLTVTDANGCVNTTNQNVTVNPQPVVAAIGNTVCENFNANLSASGGVTYSWTGPGGFTSTSSNPTITNAQLNSSGQYVVLVTDANTCTNTAVATLIVNPAPVAQIVTNSPICINHILTLTGSGGVTYLWSGPNGFFSSVQTPTIMANTTGYSGNYVLTVVDANGCSASASASAVVNNIPNIAIASTKNAGCPTFCSDFTFSSSSPIQQYNWNLGNGVTGSSTTGTGCYSTTGIYTVTAEAIDIYGCTNTSSSTVEVYPIPVADFNHAPIKPIINIDPEVTFSDASYNANIISWNWYFMNTAQYTSTQQNPTFMYTDPGTYVVALVVKSDKGCIDTILRPLVVGEDFGIYVPNAFTPNGDGLNDVFQPKGFGVTQYELNIYDRWGERMFHTKNFEDGWNGTKQANHDVTYDIKIEEGVYTWLIDCTDVFGKAHELKGHITLIK